MIPRRILAGIGFWLLVLGLSAHCEGEGIGVYEAGKLAAERPRLEKKTAELWKAMYGHLLTPDEQAALKEARLEFPTLSPDGSPLNFFADSGKKIVILPIHSLLLLEDVCTAYAWLHQNGYSAITINEYASMLKHRKLADFPGGVFPPLKALGIPDNALSDKKVDELSLRFRNSAYAYVLAHEMGHILHGHPGNVAVRPDVSRTHEQQADEFALRVLRRDKQIPIGSILFFQTAAFVASPDRFDFETVDEWQKALGKATHPVTSERIRAVAEGLRDGATQYRENREAALDISNKLKRIAAEMDDPDWHLYFRNIGQRADLARLLPRKQ